MTKNQEIGVHFYMQDCDKYGNLVPNTQIDLEEHFEGLMYSKAEGLLAKGKIKNVYSEQYADSDRLRVHYPDTPAREQTTVTFTFYIAGENRQQVYDNLYNYLISGFHSFWDTIRHKKVFFYAPNEYKPSEEVYVGSKPYLKLVVEVQNIFGTTFDVPAEN